MAFEIAPASNNSHCEFRFAGVRQIIPMSDDASLVAISSLQRAPFSMSATDSHGSRALIICFSHFLRASAKHLLRSPDQEMNTFIAPRYPNGLASRITMAFMSYEPYDESVHFGYEIADIDTTGKDFNSRLREKLNEYGKDGWEVVAILNFETKDVVKAVLKLRIK
jgi:hypothetical protein